MTGLEMRALYYVLFPIQAEGRTGSGTWTT